MINILNLEIEDLKSHNENKDCRNTTTLRGKSGKHSRIVCTKSNTETFEKEIIIIHSMKDHMKCLRSYFIEDKCLFGATAASYLPNDLRYKSNDVLYDVHVYSSISPT